MSRKRVVEAGELVGWRCWEVRRYTYDDVKRAFLISGNDAGENYLSSLVFFLVWRPEQREAMTGSLDYDAGIHAYKVHKGVEEWTLSQASLAHPLAVGSVELWGDVIEHEHGYRAQYAKILGIDYVIDHMKLNETLLADLQRFYLKGKSTITMGEESNGSD